MAHRLLNVVKSPKVSTNGGILHGAARLGRRDERTPAASAGRYDASCDVVVAGAGIAGIATALALSRKGAKVVVVDPRPPLTLTSALVSQIGRQSRERSRSVSPWIYASRGPFLLYFRPLHTAYGCICPVDA